MDNRYNSQEWEQARTRTLLRDANRCSLGRLFGGDCHPVLHVHHLRRPEDGGEPYADLNLLTVCASHHPQLEALRRAVARRERRRCPHRHPYPGAREACERKLARI